MEALTGEDRLHLILSQTEEAQERHPNLELQRDYDGVLWLRGKVGFEIEYQGRTLEDCYELALEIPDDYPNTPPLAYEVGSKIPADFGHFMTTGNLCLEAPVEVRRCFSTHRNLLRFIDDQVLPYLFSYSYKREFGELPYKDRPHGPIGLLDYYSEFFRTPPVITLKLVALLASPRLSMRSRCPCGSGQRVKNCHASCLEELRRHMSTEYFRDELELMVWARAKYNAARALPVGPNRKELRKTAKHRRARKPRRA